MKATEPKIPLGISGPPTLRNKGALSWSRNGLVAVGCGTEVIVLDSASLNVVANLCGLHKSSVNMVLWSPFGRPFVTGKEQPPPDLISIDVSSALVTWDVQKCQSISSFSHPDSKVLLDAKWSNGFDSAQKSKLFLLYSSNLIVILDVVSFIYQTISIVESLSTSMDYFFFSFDVDPFCASYSSTIALLTDNSISFVQNWDPLKLKQEKMITSDKMMLKIKSSSPNPSPSSSDLHNASSKRHNSTSGIRKLVSDIVGTEIPLIPGQSFVKPDGILEYHRNLKDHLIVFNSNTIFLVNTYFKVILSLLNIDRSTSPLLHVIPSVQRPAIISLHESGTIYLRKYIISGTHSLSVALETICCSDQPRFSSKKCEILGMILDPNNENKIILHLIDGRYVQYDILGLGKAIDNFTTTEDKQRKHLITPMTPSISIETSFAIESNNKEISTTTVKKRERFESNNNLQLCELMQNILEQETENNLRIKLSKVTSLIGILTCLRSNSNQNIIVAGTSQGYILVFKVTTEGQGGQDVDNDSIQCKIVKRFSVHSNAPVYGIEFIAEDEIVTFANLSFSANPKCELILTNIWTGATRVLKQDEPFHIGFIKVSPLKQFFVLAYKNGMAPCELWNVDRRQLVKTLPSKLPSITCATWKRTTNAARDETFFMTDLGTFLFTFRIDGNRFASATCVKLDTAGNTGGVPVSLISRDKLVFRGDSSGTLVIYDTEKKTASSGVSIGRGPLLKLEAGEGNQDGLFVAQFNEHVELWDLVDVKKVRSLNNGRQFKAADVCWFHGYLATIPRNSGGIKFVNICEPQATSPVISKILTTNMGLLAPSQKCIHILQLLKSSASAEEFLTFFQRIGAIDELKLWSIFTKFKRPADMKSEENGFNLFTEKKVFKEVLTKLAQSVWFTEVEKREDVAKVLLWAGESEKAAEILLDTEPSGSLKYISNGMKAGLCVGSTQLPEATKAVLKIIATNLIACGEIDEGLELLCLLSKHSEAVKYLESSNDWSRAILLSKTSLNEKQSNETLAKYGQFLNNHRHIIRSACVYAYVGKFDRTIEVLFGGRKRFLSYLLLTYCDQLGIELSLNQQMRLAIRLDFARFVFDCGLMKDALKFCDTIGNEAKDLKSELEILST